MNLFESPLDASKPIEDGDVVVVVVLCHVSKINEWERPSFGLFSVTFNDFRFVFLLLRTLMSLYGPTGNSWVL